MSEKVQVEATLNGESVEFLCEPRQSLLEVLRDVLGFTGSKEGCLTGDCGACSVVLDGRLVCSCLVFGPEANGKTVETVEGMAKDGTLHPLQQKFLEHAALQCGICTPGFLVAAKVLLDKNPNPTEHESVTHWRRPVSVQLRQIVRAVLDTPLLYKGDKYRRGITPNLR
jgi:carbon-monoxide dehydrogenase small subunit